MVKYAKYILEKYLDFKNWNYILFNDEVHFK